MKKSFKEVCAELYSNYEQIEKLKSRYNKIAIIKGVNALVFFIAILKIIFNIFQKDISINSFQNIILMIIIFVILLVYIKTSSESYNLQVEYKDYYKHNIIKSLIKSYDINLEYNPDGGEIERYYREAKFEEYEYIYSEDFISGENIKMAEIKTQVNEKNENGKRTRVNKFFGLFSVYELKNSITSTIDILFDKGMDDLGEQGKVLANSTEFEKYYDVYGIEKNEIMNILTPKIMESLVKIRSKSKNKFSIRLKSNKIYIRIFCGDIFESNKPIDALDVEKIKIAYDLIDIIINLSEELACEINKSKI